MRHLFTSPAYTGTLLLPSPSLMPSSSMHETGDDRRARVATKRGRASAPTVGPNVFFFIFSAEGMLASIQEMRLGVGKGIGFGLGH